ncbi:MAG: hypothetical protein ABMA01_16950 [Chthoniobacteraceae bacterium]
MSISSEFAKEFASFPAALRELVEAELAAGNAIAAIEHGFPAAPCGASIKLAQAVNDERRKSGDGFTFYARNNSSYAGEFTTAERHFFVLEPPLPPEPKPDMDAIRKAYEPRPSLFVQPAKRRVGAAVGKPRAKRKSAASPSGKSDGADSARPFTNTETPTGWTRVLHFCDKRAPHGVQFALERVVMALFTTRMDGGQLRMNATADVNGARYDFTMQFVASLKHENHFVLHIVASWGDSEIHRDYFRKSSDGWFAMWTRDLMRASPPTMSENLAEHYQKHCDAALNAERHLDSVEAVQRAIVEGVKRGGSFGDSHKEGGTNIYWRDGKFVRSDYGDYPDFHAYKDEAEFLKMLWHFSQFDVTRSAGKQGLPEFDAWKLILRRMSPE